MEKNKVAADVWFKKQKMTLMRLPMVSSNLPRNRTYISGENRMDNNSRNIRKIILKMAEKIKNEYQPEKVILFGSYAWGKPTRDSDVDFLIIKKTNERHIDRAVKVREIIDKENRMVPLDILVYTPKELKQRLKARDGFIKTILTKGEVVYE